MSKTMSWNLGAGPNRRSGGSIRPAKQAWAHSFLSPSNVNRCSAWQSGQRIREALLSPHEPATDDEGEARAGIAAIEVALDDLLDDRPKIPALILFAPEGCKAYPPSRSASRILTGTGRSYGTAPGRASCAPDVEDDRFSAHREG